MKNIKGRPLCIYSLSIMGLSLLITGCNDNDHDQNVKIRSDKELCSIEHLSKSFTDTHYKVLAAHYFNKDQNLILEENTAKEDFLAPNNVCVVKVLVGPETNSNDKGSPSYSEGIGVEVWLPDTAQWNKRIHVKGGGGWAGGEHLNTNYLVGLGASNSPATIATIEGAVSATTDTGHRISGNGSFAMNADGTINTALWKDFAERGIHEMAVVTKKMTENYYNEKAKYSYWDGFSTGGRQALKEAQVNPNDFDGILAGAPAINWTHFITSELYPQVVMQQDLGGELLTKKQLDLASNRAIAECGNINGQNYGYILDPSTCSYDPSQDKDILCTNENNDECLTSVQAQAINKIWYGQTEDGSVPNPQIDNSFNLNLSEKQRWYGLTRGTNLEALAGNKPFGIATDLVALIQQDSKIAQPSFINKMSNGLDYWKYISYQQLNHTQDLGLTLQKEFSNINTNNPDLSSFNKDGRKLIIYHGLADTLIMPQGTLKYIHEMNKVMGEQIVNSFMKAYFIPGMGHSYSNGTSNPNANVALPDHENLYRALTDWVEKGIEPSDQVAYTADRKRSLPICIYPKKISYQSGDISQSTSYKCI